MGGSGLDVFDKTLQSTHIWLDGVMEVTGTDRHTAWHVLGAVLRTLRDRLPLGLAAHLGAQLPLLVRGAYYDQFQPAREPLLLHTEDEFLSAVQEALGQARPVDIRDATRSVLAVLSLHVSPEEIEKVKRSLPAKMRRLWPGASELA